MTIDKEVLVCLLADVKSPPDLKGENGFLKITYEGAAGAKLECELTDHLGYEKRDPAGRNSGNSRNDKSKKTLTGDFGEMSIEVPCNRNGTFEPQVITKGRACFDGFDESI